MNIRSEKLLKGQVALHLELAPPDLEAFLERATQKLASELKVPGFRPGRVPRPLIEKRIGLNRLWEVAIDEAAADLVTKAVLAEKLTTVGKAEVSVSELVPGQRAVLRALVNLLPSVELIDLTKLKVERRTARIPEGELERTLSNLQRMFAKERRVQRPAKLGDRLEIDLEVFRDRVPIEGGASRNHPMVLGEDHHIPGFEEQLLGLAEGQTKEFTLRFPKPYTVTALAGQEGEFRVRVKAIYEIEKPPIDDAFAKTVGRFDSLEELKAKVNESLVKDAETREAERYELSLLEEAIQGSRFGDLPETLIEAELEKMLHELRHEVQSREMKYEDYLQSVRKNEAEIRKDFRPSAERRVKSALLLREVAERHRLAADDREVQAELDRERKLHADDPKLLTEVNSVEYRAYLKNVLISRKAMAKLKELAGKP